MKRLTLLALTLLLVTPAASFAMDFTTITFAQTSSAKTATPNLRIAVQKTRLARDSGSNIVQGAAMTKIYNYYLTKSITHPFDANDVFYYVQTDQDTKHYFGTDLTNYLVIQSGVPFSNVVK